MMVSSRLAHRRVQLVLEMAPHLERAEAVSHQRRQIRVAVHVAVAHAAAVEQQRLVED